MESLGFFGILKAAAQILRKNLKHFVYLSVGVILPIAIALAISPAFDTKESVASIKLMIAKLSSAGRGHDDQLPPPTPLPAGTSLALLVLLLLSISMYTSFVYKPTLTTSLCRGYLDKPLRIKSSLKFALNSLTALVFTFLCLIGAFTVLMVAVAVVSFLLAVIFVSAKLNAGIPTVIVVLVGVVGMLYLGFIWSLAMTVTVLEQRGGWDALRRSAFLLKGHKGAAFWLMVFLGASGVFLPISMSKEASLASRIIMAVLNILLLALISLYSAATTVVLYISCKIYHNESVEALPAAMHLEEDDSPSKYMHIDSLETQA